ncbi:hypothetical protein VII00023_07744 [Vibrio ichthyoenteri ATCC 700023]|uniref:HEAT repeat domain-containing protein n=1 Tax=Vibrio ichthyoenteri ATCC 700023 TaxID=870968 RepID=F9S4G8_9VIBR|nr:hypothetical protein [Vibrio ichthyoenteri]EGU36837.1 hypothetical protein VII00023_07744 [Vibrio ichthyoenteri ATCC 700023]
MQQGMLSSLLLSIFLALVTPNAVATEMPPERVELWLQSDHMHNKVSELLQHVVEDDLDSLNFSLQRLAFPQQEVARYLLLQKLEQQEMILTPKMAIFVEQQKSMVPTYQILEQGDGYEFSIPAFNFPAIASRLLKRWQQDQSILDFVMQAERQELDLHHWLSEGSDYQRQTREKLLIRELDSLSLEAVNALTRQLTDEVVVSWLPSSEVMVRLAQVSEDPKTYKLVWLMKADHHSQNELSRLAQVGDAFSQQQIMQASNNPNLRQLALQELTRIKPMSEEVKTFLVARMRDSDEASFVADQLAQQGYSAWLSELILSDKKVKRNAIISALSQ